MRTFNWRTKASSGYPPPEADSGIEKSARGGQIPPVYCDAAISAADDAPAVAAELAPAGARVHVLPYLLVALTFIVYHAVGSFDFVNFDDDDYITENEHVRQGMTPASVKWALTTRACANWHPITWISHQLDVQFFGMSPGAHHMTNVLLHALTVVLLYHFLVVTTGAWRRALFAAAVFAVHPLHIESVAWVSERKDVLAGVFWMLTLLAYVRIHRGPSPPRRGAVVLWLTIGLMCKPMLITMPGVLLLLDLWPLGRLRPPRRWRDGKMRRAFLAQTRACLAEKWPLFLLAAGSAVVTIWAQQQGGAVKGLGDYPMSVRMGNATISYVTYLRKTVWPTDLAVFYPHPGASLSWITAAIAATALGAVSLLALRTVSSRPVLFVAWAWFLGTLVPVIGLVQVGSQALADRYMYMPMVGLLLGFWLVPPPHSRAARLCAWAGGTALVAILAGATLAQMPRWRNSLTLFEHALAATGDSDVVHNNLAIALANAGRPEAAVSHYRRALALNPRNIKAWNNLGETLATLGLTDEALAHYAKALALDPRYWPAQYNRGVALAAAGRLDEAITALRHAAAMAPDQAVVHNYIGIVLSRQDKLDIAEQAFRRAAVLRPGFPEALNNLAVTLARQGRFDAAAAVLRDVLRRDPRNAAAKGNLGRVLRDRARSVSPLPRAVSKGGARPDG